jgi:ATP-dependent Clp protease protease subunit
MKWFKINNLAPKIAQISILNEIGFEGVSASQFINELQSLGNVAEIELHIHSPGGNLLDGLAIYNALKRHPAKIHGIVDGIAASAASIILMASDTITMPEDAFLMIHNAQGGIYGDAEDLRGMADTMEKLQSSAVDIYQTRTGLDRQEILTMMSNETWMTASEAKQLGFCDNVLGRVSLAAKARQFDQRFKFNPLGEPDWNELETERDFERFFRNSGLSKTESKLLFAKAKALFSRPLDQMNAEDRAYMERLEAFSTNIPKSLIH